MIQKGKSLVILQWLKMTDKVFKIFLLKCRVIPPIMLYTMNTNTITITIGFGK